MKSRGHHRPERAATLIQQLLAQALTTRLKDPRVGFVTLTSVTVTPDLSHATVRVSVLGTEEEKEQALAGLEHARGFLRTLLAQATDLRTTPGLHFEIDRGLEHASHIDTLLADIKRRESES